MLCSCFSILSVLPWIGWSSDDLSAVASWVAIAAAGFIVWRQNRVTKRMVGMQSFLQLCQQYDSEAMQGRRARLAKRLLSDPTARDLDDTVLVFFENLAYLTRKKVIDPDMVYNVFSIDVCNYWLAVRPYVESIRREADDGTLFEEMEELSKAMQAYQWRGPAGRMSRPGLRGGTPRFLEWESSRGS